MSFCRDSGDLYSDNCLLDPRKDRIGWGYFKKDDIPSILCRRHVICRYDSLTHAVAHDGCVESELVDIALVEINDRSFPCEIIISDAEYVYRRVDKQTPLGESYTEPFFVNTLNEGEYVGKSKNKKQYNSSCYVH